MKVVERKHLTVVRDTTSGDAKLKVIGICIYSLTSLSIFSWAVFQKGVSPWWFVYMTFLDIMFLSAVRSASK